ncbi:MAG: hypothetical protein B9S32_14515 [Verrucomicrobia bacterium Tous-C9LFEB]|nr:MAG: hypothetical protein B9S32_14515 [Verrucomicrobia bacterium Tous-C9LFEB]
MSIFSPMRSCIKILRLIWIVIALIGTIPHLGAVTNGSPDRKVLTLPVWQTRLDEARALALQSRKPMLIYFHSPTSVWCAAFKSEILNTTRLQPLLEQFVLVEIDPTRDTATAGKYKVMGTPAVRLLTSSGAAINTLDGAMSLDDFEAALRLALNPESAFTGEHQDMDALFDQLRHGNVAAHVWPSLMMALGDEKKRETVHERLTALQPVPRQELVSLLEDPRLTVRLGAMEILEELADDSFLFNPWKDDGMDAKGEALDRWKAWAQGKSPATMLSRSVKLTREEVGACVRDLISEDRDRSARALRRLSLSERESLPVLRELMANDRELSVRARLKVKESIYLLTLQGRGVLDAGQVAHQLVFGNMDNRLQAIAELAKARAAAVPILMEFLLDREPVVRETALDTCFIADPSRAVSFLEKSLPQEKDTNVLLSASRGLGSVDTPQSIALLRSMLADSREEVVSAALRSLGEMKASSVEPDIRRLLEDSRWRVRVTAMEAAMAIPLNSLAKEIAAHVTDPDEFVRISAVTALGKLEGKQHTEVLDQAFFRDDALKPAVLDAYEAIDRPVPATFIKGLENKPPGVLLSVLSAINSTKGANALIPLYLVKNKDMDVSCAAIRVMAKRGMEQSKCVEALTAVLRNGPDEKRLAVFDSLRINEVKQSLQAVKRGPSSVQNKSQSVLNQFMQSLGPDSTETSTGDVKGDFASAVLLCTESKTSSLLAQQASLCLLKAGSSIGLEKIGDPATLPLEARLALVESLEDMDSASALLIFQKYSLDPAEEIRVGAVKGFLERKKIPVSLIIGALANSESTPITSQIIGEFSRVTESEVEFRKQAIEALKSVKNPKLQTLILTGINKPSPTNTSVALDFVKVSDPYQRRAAWYAFGRMGPGQVAEHVDEIVNDPSPLVREVLPALVTYPNYRWKRYVDKDNFNLAYDYDRRAEKVELTPEVSEALVKLTSDRDAHVRVAAFLALISNRAKIDVEQMQRAIQNDPDREWIANALSIYFERNKDTVPVEYASLLDLAEAKHRDSDFKRIRARWKQEETGSAGTQVTSAKESPDTNTSTMVSAEPISPKNSQPTAPEQAIKLVFFESPGCAECLKIEKILKRLRETVPGLAIETQNIRSARAMRLNETLSEQFGVPANLRLVAPAIFTGGGFLIKGDITEERLSYLIAASAEIPEKQWYHVEEAKLAEADQAITSRYNQFNVGLILLAGLLDGINPCAFATIIFFLSYLQVARRTPSQIAQVGVAFVVAVFLTYFLLGLGLIEVVGRLVIFKWLGTLLNAVLALFSLLVAALSFRDGVLCLRGKMTEMTLQLPELLKSRIHTVVRTQVRQSRFVLAAFGSGVVISLLELACTGQVYAPTILFMFKIDQGRTGTLFYLLAYNLAFILPLLTIFLLSYFGMRSEVFGRFLNRHAALIKFATAALFLVLFLLIAMSSLGSPSLGRFFGLGR